MSGDNEDKKKCVFCAQETLEKIIYFTSETLKKSLSVLEYRRAKPIKRKSRKSELRQHLLRTKYIACLWRNAHFRIASEMSPTDFGWKNEEGKLEMVWFTGNQLPEAYEDIVVTPEILGNTSESDTQDMDENDQSDLNFQFDEDSTDDEN
ncbi:hypothetical protein HHI36_016368 [Cryptolaemus montrouzieri]|uniref:Uncharacterized protein n=1 Tax=Cryptolaemus montrouzieri TaxID=559131 RepID=A0ABD2NJN4_9CUCU